MPSKLAVSRGLGTLTAGATFEQDLRHVMWRRGRLALGVGLTLTILFNLLGRWVFRMPEPLGSQYAGWVPNVYLSLLIPFALGLALVWNDRWTSRQVAFIVLAALVVSNLLDAATSTVVYPAQDNFLGAAFFLFLTAALVPWPLVYQVALGTVVTLSYPIFALIASATASNEESYALQKFARSVMKSNNLALAKMDSGDHDAALALFEGALLQCQHYGDRHWEAALQNNLADLYHKLSNEDASMAHLKAGITILAEIGREAGDWQPEIWKLSEW